MLARRLLPLAALLSFEGACGTAPKASAVSAEPACDTTWVEVARVVAFADYEHADADPRVRSARAALDEARIPNEGMQGGIAHEEDGTCSDLLVQHQALCGWYALVVPESEVTKARAALEHAGITPVDEKDATTASKSEGAQAECRRKSR